MNLHDVEMSIRAVAEPAVADLETRRKSNPEQFYRQNGKPSKDGVGYTQAITLASALRGWLERLERL